MNNSRVARLVAGALLLLAGPVVFGQLADREVVAGGIYQENLQVLCILGGGSTSKTNASIGEVFFQVQVLPPAFRIILRLVTPAGEATNSIPFTVTP